MMRCSQTRSPNVRGLLLADVDMGRRLRVIGKGSKERHVPVDAAFFTELAAYLRWERPPGLAGSQCFVAARINLTLAEDFTGFRYLHSSKTAWWQTTFRHCAPHLGYIG